MESKEYMNRKQQEAERQRLVYSSLSQDSIIIGKGKVRGEEIHTFCVARPRNPH